MHEQTNSGNKLCLLKLIHIASHGVHEKCKCCVFRVYTILFGYK